MLKILIVLAAGYVLVSFLNTQEIDTSSIYAAHPYDRCMEAHQDMPQQEQCKYLKGSN